MEKEKKAISQILGYRLETVDGGIFLNADEVEAIGQFLITGKRVQVNETTPAPPVIRRQAIQPNKAAAAPPAPKPAPAKPVDAAAALEAAARRAALGEGPGQSSNGAELERLEAAARSAAREMAV